jgi:molybdate transport system ATP-binding protein
MASEIVLTEISKSFNKKEVFTNFSYSFKLNNIYKIKGANGSGKTTLLKIIKGIYLPDSGTIKANFKLAENISYIDNNPRSFFHRLNVSDNLEYFLSLNKPTYQLSIVEELMDFFEIFDFRKTLFSDLSQGQMQLISIIRGLANEDKVIILDESFSFLDKNIKLKLQTFLIDQNKKEKNLILFCSHDDIFSESNFIELEL